MYIRYVCKFLDLVLRGNKFLRIRKKFSADAIYHI